MPKGAEQIIFSLEQSGYEAFVVGGCIRDILLGRDPHDWDICTSATPEEIKAVFDKQDLSIIDTGIKHGTVTIMMENTPYEVTTYRVDGDYSDHRHPSSVSYTKSIEADLERRDFTMNAMAYNSKAGLIDPYGGADDLTSRVIRCVGDPDTRFDEDALRILRAVRFESVFGFTVEKKTESAITSHIDLLGNVSAERKRDELCKILMGRYVFKALGGKHRNVIAAVIPEVTATFDFNQYNPWHIYDIWKHTVFAISEADDILEVRLAMLFHDLGKPNCFTRGEDGRGHFYGHGEISAAITEERLRRLHFSNEMTRTITELVRIHDNPLPTNKRNVRKLLSKIGIEQARRLYSVRTADVLAQALDKAEERLDKARLFQTACEEIVADGECLRMRDLAIKGDDLIAIGYESGVMLGNELKRLFALVLGEPSHNNKDELLARAIKDKERRQQDGVV